MNQIFADTELGGVKVGLKHPVRIMGVINLSPESFYKRSVVTSVKKAYDVATNMVESGADLIDIGGMSTAPYKDTYIPVEEEIRRIKPVVKELAKSLEVPISIDTRRSAVAEAALNLGARIVNDTSGLKNDDKMVDVVRDSDASLIVMAYGEVDPNIEPITNIRRLLKNSLEKALSNGIRENKIVIDPGIGFFRDTGLKWYEWDANIIRNLRRLLILGRPILIGVSRKSFIGEILNLKDPEERLIGSVAAEAIAVYNGASIIRTHNVTESIQAVRLAEYIRPKIRHLVHDSGLVLTDLDTIFSDDELVDLMEMMNVDRRGAEIMSSKGVFKVVYIYGVPKILALIIKQEMLAIGGEAATPSDTLFSGFEPTSILLMGTKKHLNILINKMRSMDLKSIKERSLPNASDLAEALGKIIELSSN